MRVRRVVVDTNIEVSALVAGGNPQRIIRAWIAGEFLALISLELQNEINAVLSRTKLVTFDKKRRDLLGTLFNQALMVLPKRIDKVILPDESDHFLHELAATGQAEVIVTGDKALLKTKKIGGIPILNPSQFCKIYRIS